MNITYQELLASTELISQLMAVRPSQENKCNAQAVLQLARAIKPLNEELGHFNAARLAILQKYGISDPETNQYTYASPEVEQQAQKELAELLSTSVSLALTPIPFNVLDPHIVAANISAAELSNIIWLLEP